MSGIRFATEQDIPGLVEIGRRLHPLTRFRAFNFEPERVGKAFADVIEKGQGRYVLFVAESGAGEIVGGLLGVLEQHIFSSQMVASIVHIDVLPERRMGGYGLRLIHAFEKWASNRKVVEINFGINSLDGEERVARFAKRIGFRKTGENYFKRLHE